MKRALHWVIAFSTLLLAGGSAAFAQQVTDTEFNVSVAKPAYAIEHPRVFFDEAHFNVHTMREGYKPFASLVANDGYQVVANDKKFDAESLKGCRVLVIANARGAAMRSEKPAFTEAECDAVRDWISAGGALLLVTDHYPIGHAAENLGQRFGVNMSKGTTSDPAHQAAGAGGPSCLEFTRAGGLLGDHAITRGRNDGEKLNKIITFTGQSLKGPEGSVSFLKLSDTAVDRLTPAAAPGGKAAQAKGKRRAQSAAADGPPVSAAGRSQGLALKLGKGRVVVLGEASELSAQLAGPQKRPMGMNYPGSDNRQMALNIMHWLSGLTE